MRDERITFQEESTTYNSFNEPVVTWSNISTDPTMWAEAMPRTSNEDFTGDQKSGFQRYNWKVLHRSDITVKMRINWDNRYWDIVAVEPLHKDDYKKYLIITAEWKQGQYNV